MNWNKPMEREPSTSNDSRASDYAVGRDPRTPTSAVQRERAYARWENEGGALSQPPVGRSA